MPEILSYDFMLRAFAAGVLIAITLPFLGTFLVAKRYSLIADSLAHVSLAGVGAAMLIGTSPLLIALPFSIICALALEWLHRQERIHGDVSLAILMSGGLALAVVFAGLSQGSGISFTNYLFGSITTTSSSDVKTLAIVCALALGLLLGYYRSFVHSVYSPIDARLSGAKEAFLSYALVAMTAAVIVLSLRVVGGLLMGALIVIPVVSASKIAHTFRSTIMLAIGYALFAVIFGLTIAFYVGIAAGGAIVLSSLVLLTATMFVKK